MLHQVLSWREDFLGGLSCTGTLNTHQGHRSEGQGVYERLRGGCAEHMSGSEGERLEDDRADPREGVVRRDTTQVRPLRWVGHTTRAPWIRPFPRPNVLRPNPWIAPPQLISLPSDPRARRIRMAGAGVSRNASRIFPKSAPLLHQVWQQVVVSRCGQRACPFQQWLAPRGNGLLQISFKSFPGTGASEGQRRARDMCSSAVHREVGPPGQKLTFFGA